MDVQEHCYNYYLQVTALSMAPIAEKINLAMTTVRHHRITWKIFLGMLMCSGGLSG